MQLFRKAIWHSPEEIVEIAYQRASVVMTNEAHSGWTRCIRTRQIGKRILPIAHQADVRYLAMEAFFFERLFFCKSRFFIESISFSPEEQ